MLRRAALAIASVALLVGCQTTSDGAINLAEMYPAEWEFSKLLKDDANLLAQTLAGNTVVQPDPIFAGPYHGTQIEYHRADGAAFLWYPGNTGMVRGNWKVVSKAREDSQLCYKYGPNTYNPVTERRGGQWNCVPYFWSPEDRVLRGDPFRLGTGRIPYVIPDKKRYSAEDVARRAGIPTSRLVDVMPRTPR